MSLCLSCGLCCDGTMFEVAALTPDEATRYGDRVTVSSDRKHLRLPCPALDGCKCTTYRDRPAVCSTFKCLALASLDEGLMTEQEAHDAIEEVLGRRRQITTLMGMTDDRQALVAARKQVVAGTAPEALVAALGSLNRALLVMLLRPEDTVLRGKKY